MSYQVLARKWRPRNFQEMVGQEAILRMLMNALDHQRLHHAYLFTGTRGVGKTTLARIFAKCLNCESGITSKPCGTCSICQSIDAGRFLDLIEIDAASRTKVEDTREILDNVQYSPTQGRYKIYLIDEVHMLSGHSFNALLKTLEEPPAHVKFLLATTDPKRLPVTILSRCLQFNLKRVVPEQISQHLQHICTTETIPFEIPALELIAKAADGSMRDALSLLDQTIAYCGQQVSLTETRAMLGNIEQDVIFRLLHALAKNDGKELLQEVTALAENAPDFNYVLEELLSTLHQISVAQIVAETTHDEINLLAKEFSPEDVQLYYQIALMGRKDLPLASNPQQGFEMVMIRMLAFKPSYASSSSTAGKPTNNIAPAKPKDKIITPVVEHSVSAPTTQNAQETNWTSLLSKLELSGMAQVLASNCTLKVMDESRIELALSPQHEPMLNKKLIERIEQALNRSLNKTIKLDIKVATEEIQTPAKQQQQEKAQKHASATDAIQNDIHVKQMLDMFDATLDVNSIKAVE